MCMPAWPRFIQSFSLTSFHSPALAVLAEDTVTSRQLSKSSESGSGVTNSVTTSVMTSRCSSGSGKALMVTNKPGQVQTGLQQQASSSSVSSAEPMAMEICRRCPSLQQRQPADPIWQQVSASGEATIKTPSMNQSSETALNVYNGSTEAASAVPRLMMRLDPRFMTSVSSTLSMLRMGKSDPIYHH